MDSLVTWVVWNLISVCLEMLVSVQDRCTICTKRTIGSEIILGATDGTLGDMAQLEAHFNLFRECYS
jgi:hypothetical protein